MSLNIFQFYCKGCHSRQYVRQIELIAAIHYIMKTESGNLHARMVRLSHFSLTHSQHKGFALHWCSRRTVQCCLVTNVSITCSSCRKETISFYCLNGRESKYLHGQIIKTARTNKRSVSISLLLILILRPPCLIARMINVARGCDRRDWGT